MGQDIWRNVGIKFAKARFIYGIINSYFNFYGVLTMAKMKLSLRNVGMINKADIEIGGLTIIAGKNNCGKSTVGKVLFSLITAINRHKSVLGETKNTPLSNALENIYRLIFGIDFPHRTSRVPYYEFMKFRPRAFLDDIERFGFQSAKEVRLELLSNLFNKRLIGSSQYEKLTNLLEKLSEVVSQEDKTEDILARSFNKLFYSEFLGVIENKSCNSDFKISLSLGRSVTIKISKKDSIYVDINKKITNMEDLEALVPYKDSLIIESPFILNVYNSISTSRAIFEKRDMAKRDIRFISGIVQFHILDLIRKIKEPVYDKTNADKLGIPKIIGGDFEYDSKKDEFIYKIGSQTHNSINVASGIKSFGILQMLLNTQYLNEHSLLILDEPEVHLHPEWQLKYAEVLIKTIKEYNIPILVTSHSPYMLQALELYAKQVGKIKYSVYHAHKDKNNLCVFDDVSNDLSPIYEDLLQSIDELEFIQYKLSRQSNEK